MSKKVNLLLALLVVASMLVVACQPAAAPAQPAAVEPTAAPAEPSAASAEPTVAPAAPAAAEDVTLAIEHFSPIEGTTWSGAHDRAGKRLAEKYPNVQYIYRENVGPDLSVPYGEEMIAEGADIVVGNDEFLSLIHI